MTAVVATIRLRETDTDRAIAHLTHSDRDGYNLTIHRGTDGRPLSPARPIDAANTREAIVLSILHLGPEHNATVRILALELTAGAAALIDRWATAEQADTFYDRQEPLP